MYIEVNKVGDNYEVTPNVTPTVTYPLQAMTIEVPEDRAIILRGINEIPDTIRLYDANSDLTTGIWSPMPNAETIDDEQMVVCGNLRYNFMTMSNWGFIKLDDAVYGVDLQSDYYFSDLWEFTVDSNAPYVTYEGDSTILEPGEVILPSEDPPSNIVLHPVSGRDCFYLTSTYPEDPYDFSSDCPIDVYANYGVIVVSIDWSQHLIAINKYVFRGE